MFGGLGMGEMLLIFLVVLLLFGAKRLPEIGSALGKGIREFKGSVREIEGELKAADRPRYTPTPREPEPQTHRRDELPALPRRSAPAAPSKTSVPASPAVVSTPELCGQTAGSCSEELSRGSTESPESNRKRGPEQGVLRSPFFLVMPVPRASGTRSPADWWNMASESRHPGAGAPLRAGRQFWLRSSNPGSNPGGAVAV